MTTPPYPQQPDGSPAQPYAGASSSPAAPSAPAYAPAHPGAPAYTGAPAYDYAAAAPAAPSERNALGLVALIVGVVALFFDALRLILQAVLISVRSYQLLGTVNITISVLQGLLAAAAIVCGAIALGAKGKPKAQAGIALGIGVAVLWGVLTALMYNGLLPLIAR